MATIAPAAGFRGAPHAARPALAEGAAIAGRDAPSLDGVVVAALPAGARLRIDDGPTLDGDQRPWFLTAPAGLDRQVWLPADDIAFDDPPTAQWPTTTHVTGTAGEGLRLRSGASLAANVLAVMPDGASVFIIGATSVADGLAWAPVMYQGTSGYAAADYLRTIPAGPRRSLAYFSKPMSDGASVATLATAAGIITLTHGDEAYRDQLRAVGYGGPVLEYIVSAEVDGPGPYADGSAWCDASYTPNRNNVAYQQGDFCRELHPRESWFLHNGQGQRLYELVGGRVYYHMNPGDAGWQQFARDRMLELCAAFNCDGVFLDNVELSLHKATAQIANADGVVAEYDSDPAFRAAWISYLTTLSNAFRPDHHLWANMIADPMSGSDWNDYLAWLDGGIFEAFATGYHGLTAEQWDAQMTQADAAIASGKGIMAIAQGQRDDDATQRFAWASFLLVSDNASAYFRYANADAYGELWLYDDYTLNLGAPLGPRRLRDDGLWQRDFQCGSVLVDPATRQGRINPSGC